MRAEVHYKNLQNRIKELTKHHPNHLVTAMSVLGIHREADGLRQSSDAGHQKHDTVGDVSTQDGGSARASGIWWGESGEEQPLLGANLDANAISVYENSKKPATSDDKVRRWANTQSVEVLGDSSSQDSLNETSYSSTGTNLEHDASSIVQDTKADETERFTTHSQMKDAAIEFFEALLSKIKDVLEALSQFRAKIPLNAQDIIAQHGELFNQVRELRETIHMEYEEVRNTPTESESFDPNQPGADMKAIQGMRRFLEIVCGVAEKLFHMTLKDQEDWTANTCAEKWSGIADRFEWETALPLTIAFTIFIKDKEPSQELKNMRNPIERAFERQSLLDITGTSGDLLGANNG